MIITIARQRGSGGTQISKALSETYGLPVYNLRALSEAARKKGLLEAYPAFFAERPLDSLLSVLSLEADHTAVYKVPGRLLQQLLPPDNFILIGRCGNVVYKDQPACIRIFLGGEFSVRTANIMARYGLPRNVAEEKVKETDAKRCQYHEYYTGQPWGRADQYDLCLNSCRAGFKATREMIEAYVNSVAGQENNIF